MVLSFVKWEVMAASFLAAEPNFRGKAPSGGLLAVVAHFHSADGPPIEMEGQSHFSVANASFHGVVRGWTRNWPPWSEC
jgi:hypothetical protein